MVTIETLLYFIHGNGILSIYLDMEHNSSYHFFL